MSSSENSEVINRSRHHKKTRRIIGSDNFEEESSRGSQYGEYAPIFLEIFGTGHEYDYALEEGKKEDIEEEPQENSPPFDVKACLEFIKGRIPTDDDQLTSLKMIQDLEEGVSPEFIALHCTEYSVCQIYYLYDLIQLYKSTDKPARAVKPSDCSLPGILSLSDYITNLRSRERIFEPSGDVPSSNKDDSHEMDEYTTIINQISANPTFQDVVNLVYEQSKASVLFECQPSVTKEMLCRLFTTDEASSSNDVRRRIIEEAYRRVVINYGDINGRLLLCGCNIQEPTDESTKFLFSGVFNSLDRLTNCITSLCGRPGSYAGLFYERGYCKVVTIDRNGNVTGQTAFKEQFLTEIRAFVANSDTVCVSSDTPSVRYLVQNLNVPVLYVPSTLSYFNDLKDYSTAYNIALLVQNPFIYFARLVRSTSSDRSRRGELITRAIRTAMAIVKPDWRTTLKHKYFYALLPILRITFSQKYFDYSNVNCLETLSSVFPSVEFNNLSTFFTLHDSIQALDSTAIHPKDYSIAMILCQSAFVLRNPEHHDNAEYNRTISNDDIKAVISDLQQLRSMAMPEDTTDLSRVRSLLLAKKPGVFPGATDIQIFHDIVPALDSKAFGIISKVGPNYYIVECACSTQGGSSQKTATVYARNTGDYLLNQSVSVDMIEPCYHLLSYRGTIVDEPAHEEVIFIKHRLLRNVDHNTLLRIMKQDNQNVLIRPSSQMDSYVIVCRLYSNIFHSVKIRVERDPADDSVVAAIYNGEKYSSLDEFIEKYIKGIYSQVRGITSYRHFFGDESDAIDYLNGKSQYIRSAVVLSTSRPGYMEFLYQNKRVPVLIDGSKLRYKERLFGSVDEFVSYAKMNFR